MKQLNMAGLIVVILISTASLAFAKFSIVPSVGIQETYNDNIFLTNANEEDDFITTVSPGVKLEYAPNQSLELTLDYGLNFRFYSDHRDLNDTDIREIQNIKFQAQARPLSRIFIDVSDTYKRIAIDVREKTAEDNHFKNKTDTNIFSVSPYTILPLTTTITTTIGYIYNNTWYRDSDGIDSESQSAFLTLNKKFTSRINGEVKYDYLTFNPDRIEGATDKYNRHQGSVAATYQITPEFLINGNVGRAWFNYESLNDVNTSFWNIGTNYILKIDLDTSLTVNYGTSFHDSTTSGGVYKSRKVDLNFATGKVLKLSVKPFHSVDKYLNTDRKDVILGAVVDISRPISERLNLSVNGSGENQRFVDKDEKVNKYSAGSNIDYTVRKNITTGVGYRYSGYKKISSDNVSDKYRNSTVWLQAKVTF